MSSGVIIGTTVGSVIPGLGTGLGATVGGIIDGLSSLFGSDMRADQRLGVERLAKFIKANNITDQNYIQQGVDGAKKYSGTSNYWSWWASYQKAYTDFKTEQDKKNNTTTIEGILSGGAGNTTPLLYIAGGVGVILIFFLLKR